jgi:anti-sigma factor RsiW
MSAHLAVGRLSALLDGELAWADRRHAEAHLQACPGCRTRLAGLEEVAERLRALQREAPPRALDLVIASPRPSSAAARRGAGRAAPLAASLFLPFAAIVALTFCLLAFAGYLERRDAAPPPRDSELVFIAPAAGEPSAEARRFRREHGVWRELGPDGPARAASPLEQAAVLRELPALGRVLVSGAVEVCWRGERIVLASRPTTRQEPR